MCTVYFNIGRNSSKAVCIAMLRATATIVAKSPWDTYKNNENHTPLNVFIFLLARTPTPLNNVVSSMWHLTLLYTWKFSIIACTSPEKQHCLEEEGDESEVQNRNMRSVSGLLTTIVHSFTLQDNNSKQLYWRNSFIRILKSEFWEKRYPSEHQIFQQNA